MGPGKGRLRGLSLFVVLILTLLPGLSSPVPQIPLSLLRDGTDEIGLRVVHRAGETPALYLPEIMGAGGALFDFDGDGDLDLFLVDGGTLGDEAPPVGGGPKHRLLRNDWVQGGKVRLTDVSQKGGLVGGGYGMGAAVGDIDNDGDLDLLVTAVGPDLLFRNNGNGTFSEVGQAAGIRDSRWTTSASFVDYDRDGDLDLYVAAYVDFTVRTHKRCFAPTGEPDYCTPAAHRPIGDRLYRNRGDGTFDDVTRAAGIAQVIGPGLGVVSGDFNGDGWPDFYVANDGAANLLWINQKDGTFLEQGLLSGVAYAMTGVPRAGMGVTAGDYDNDGDLDLLVTNLTREGFTLFRNDGTGFFDDDSDGSRIGRDSFLSTGFGVGWFDFDLDGWLDLFAANGAVTRLVARQGEMDPFRQRNQLFRNQGGSTGFREVLPAEEPVLARQEIGRGLAFGDLDNDGDPDILMTNNRGPARVLFNQARRSAGGGPHWLAIRLVGDPKQRTNRWGLGARVGLERKGQPTLWRHVQSDGSYLSASDPRVTFGLGAATRVDRLVIEWPNGFVQSVLNPLVDRQLTIRQPVPASPSPK